MINHSISQEYRTKKKLQILFDIFVEIVDFVVNNMILQLSKQ